MSKKTEQTENRPKTGIKNTSSQETVEITIENTMEETSMETTEEKKEKKKFSFPSFRIKNEKSQEEQSENKEGEIEKKKRPLWLRILLFIVLLPFRIIKMIFDLVSGCLHILLLIFIVGLCFSGVVFARVYPMYQTAADSAYKSLTHLKDETFRMHENTKVYDKDENLIGEINSGDYKYVTISDVSDYIQEGYIAVEDKHFKEHIGIDMQGIVRAAISVLKHNGETTQGGSTITQQVVKNCLLTQEQTYERKLTEILIAPKLEQMFSKGQIMEFYLNTCFYGNNCYGIETASQYYFGKTNKELTLAEAALLCGVSNSPSKYNPVASMELANDRKEKVLKNMLKNEAITQEEYEEAIAQPITLSLTTHEYENENYMTSFGIHCAVLELMKEDGFTFQYIFSSKEEEEAYETAYEESYTKWASIVRSGGYTIHTSFNQELQNKLQNATDTNMQYYTEVSESGKYALQSASVCVDNHTGYIVAMVGGRGTEDQFNRGFLSTRQPGSTIKPILVYGTAMNEGLISPSTVYTDKKVYYDEKNPESYSPKNADGVFSGDMTIREALARSKNTVAFQVYMDTGFDTALSYLDKMHFTSLSYEDTLAPSVCLGGFTNGVTVCDMAKAYATLAMGGRYAIRTCLVKLESDTEGTLYEDKELKADEVYTEDTAFMMTDAMQGVHKERYGTATSVDNGKMIFACKTGTTNSNKDLWFCGFTEGYTTATWVGYDTPKPMYKMSTIAMKVWNSYMTDIPENMNTTDFTKPDTIVLSPIGNKGRYEGELVSEFTKGNTWYESRLEGMEWYSMLNKNKVDDAANRIAEEKALREAENKVTEFESFYMNSVEDAYALQEKYDTTIGMVEGLTESEDSIALRKRVIKHYQELKKQYDEVWSSYIASYEAVLKEKAEEENAVKLEDSKLASQEKIKKDRINKAEWYLTTVMKRKYKTATTDNLLLAAEQAVVRLMAYEEYESYMERLNKAREYVEGLPLFIPQEVTPDEEDEKPINPAIYDDPAETAENPS